MDRALTKVRTTFPNARSICKKRKIKHQEKKNKKANKQIKNETMKNIYLLFSPHQKLLPEKMKTTQILTFIQYNIIKLVH